MPSQKRCQSCNAELPGDHPGAVCSACMLEQGMAEDSQIETVEIKPGRVLCGHEIVRKIGVGGMGVVYEARQMALRRSVALKMIRTPSAATEKDMARFRQEAEAAARLNHPNIVEVYEIGEFEGSPFFTMKFVDGARPLALDLAHGPFQPPKAARMVSQVSRAVAYAHQRGVIHRDLKPANILLDAESRPCLVDFGLAKLFGHSPSVAEVERSLSDDGRLIGTPYYMSPEQIRGEDLTTSTDVYSLGVVLYELLTGSPPFRARSLNDMLHDISHVPPKPLESDGKKVPRDLQVIALKCLRKHPNNRYGTAYELADDLDRWLERRPIHARPSSTANRIAKWARRNPGVAALSPIVAILALLAVVMVSWIAVDSYRKIVQEVKNGWDKAGRERLENKAGRRWRARESLGKSAGYLDLLREKDRDIWQKRLQNEAVWTLSLIDLRLSEDKDDLWQEDLASTQVIRLSPDFSTYAHVTPDERIEVRNSANVVMRSWKCPASASCQSLRFDPDQGIRLAAVCKTEDGAFQATVWNLETEEIIPVGEVEGPDALCFSEDGSSLAFTRGNSLTIRSLDQAKEDRVIGIESPARVVSLNRDGDTTRIALGWSEKPGVVLLDLESEEPLARFDDARVLDLEWNPRGRWLAMGCDDGQAVVWDTEAEDATPTDILSLSSHESAGIRHIAWHPRGVLLAGGTEKGKVHLWHAFSEKLQVTWSGDGEVIRPQFSFPDGSRLGPVIHEDQVSLLEVAEGRVVSHARGHTGKIYGAWWRDLDDKRPARVFSTAGDDGVRIWNRRGFEKAFIKEKGARSAIFTKKGLIITGEDGISFRSVTGGDISGSNVITVGRPDRTSAYFQLRRIPCFGADFDPVNHQLAVAANEFILAYRLDPDSHELPEKPDQVLAAPEHTAFVDISPDGMWLAAGTDGGKGVRVWKWENNAWVPFKDESDFRTTGSAHVVFYHDPYPGGKDWFVACGDGEYEFFELPGWVPQPDPVPGNLGAISFSPRTPVFAVSEDHKIRIYGLRDKKGRTNIHLLINPEFESQKPVCISPLGFILMTADRKNFLHLWDLRLLRSSLHGLNLDLDLTKFPLKPFEPEDPIESVILKEE